MKIVIFGLTISSSWGNGHATLWRGLCKALAQLGCDIVFFERNQTWYANSRDFEHMEAGELIIYDDWAQALPRARMELADADVAIITSYCADALAAKFEVLNAAPPLTAFYDLDTPVTLSRLHNGETVPYIGEDGLRAFDLVLSYTGGAALDALRDRLGAARVHPLYGHVDPQVHRPAPPEARYRADLSWLGTYAADRRAAMHELFVGPAQQRSDLKFLMGGAQYPEDFPWTPNMYFVQHVPPEQHAAFFCSSRLTLNVTREAMAQMGWCPSGRLFEAAACGAAILSDAWPGLDEFYMPGSEILTAGSTQHALEILDMDDATLRRIANNARERTLEQHTSHHRARELLDVLDEAMNADLGSTALAAALRSRGESARWGS